MVPKIAILVLTGLFFWVYLNDASWLSYSAVKALAFGGLSRGVCGSGGDSKLISW